MTQDFRDGKPDARKFIIIDNKLYDVTEFVEDHPGGAAVLMTHVGKDASGMCVCAGEEVEGRSLFWAY